MSLYNGHLRYGLFPYIPNYYVEGVQYPGYSTSWWGNYHNIGYCYSTPDHSSSSQAHRSEHTARLAWPTEIPTRLRVIICCDKCRMKLEKSLRNLDGVHDVSISGLENAMVTVTGTASARKILKQARQLSSTAEPWSDAHSEDQYSTAQYAYNGHHMH